MLPSLWWFIGSWQTGAFEGRSQRPCWPSDLLAPPQDGPSPSVGWSSVPSLSWGAQLKNLDLLQVQRTDGVMNPKSLANLRRREKAKHGHLENPRKRQGKHQEPPRNHQKSPSQAPRSLSAALKATRSGEIFGSSSIPRSSAKACEFQKSLHRWVNGDSFVTFFWV